jgi:3-deoxy-7-phosphoheptulonate synthase
MSALVSSSSDSISSREVAHVDPPLQLASSGPAAVPTPAQLKQTFPLVSAAARSIESVRRQASELVLGHDDRLLCVVGPCSIHDPRAALEYASRLAPLAERHRSELLVVMRVYLEKPRSSVGWKGLISDPHLDGRCDLALGLRVARQLMTEIAALGLGMAGELLDGNLAAYQSDLLCWAAIGARTTESQPHRELASSLPLPVGFKNGTDGRIEGALGGIRSAADPHRRLAPDQDGVLRLFQSRGNPHCHLTLRGGTTGPNYAAENVLEASQSAARAALPSRVLVDCSHGNSGKDHQNQSRVLDAVAQQVAAGARHVLGVMIESHLVAGRQVLCNPAELRYGQSITDACVDFESTEQMLEELARALREQRGQIPFGPAERAALGSDLRATPALAQS